MPEPPPEPLPDAVLRALGPLKHAPSEPELFAARPHEAPPQPAAPEAWALGDTDAWTVAQPRDVTDPALLASAQAAYGPDHHGPYGGIVAAPPAERRRGRTFGRLLREAAETVILAVLIFLFVRAVVQNFQVEGASMQPTLQNGWYLLVNKAIYFEINLGTVHKFVPLVDPGDDPTRYLFRGPERGDVIVFRDPNLASGQPERDFIKRIIGEPGDVVEVRDRTVFVNGRALQEPYVLEPPAYTCPPRRVPEGHYFVLGDNRNNSSDSHLWGPVPKENIIGMAWVNYWPLDILGLIGHDARLSGESPATSKEDVPLAQLGTECAS
jgi:signal peptidase I